MRPTSPFSTKKLTPAVTVNHGLTRVSDPVVTQTAITKADIDQLGSDLQVSMGRTTNKIVDAMTASNFGDIGQMLVRVENTAAKLDPSKQFGGVKGWFRSRFVDIKSYLRAEFQTAGKVFDALVVDLTKHIAKHDEWIKNLDLIFKENQENYFNLVSLIDRGEQWKNSLEQQLAGLPPIDPNDPDAMMKAQDRKDLQALINRLDQKIDTFRRLKMIAENNAPKIRGQQQTSEMNKTVLRDVIDFTIPTIRMEFSLYLNSLDSMKTQELIKNTKTFSQQTMLKSADAASKAAITSAQSLNAPMIDNPTLDTLREKILFTISEVKRIEGEAATQRLSDASTMSKSTQNFITQLTS